MESIWEVTNKNFAEFLLGKPLAVLYFWADWYSGDRYMKYRLRNLSRMYPRANFGYMDVDVINHLGMVKVLGVKMLPSVLFFCSGSKERIVAGPTSLLTLSRHIEAAQTIADTRTRLKSRYQARH